MCGIMAVKSNSSISKTINGLQKLEYRGYDSCGIAYISNNDIFVEKSVGYVSVLKDKLEKRGICNLDHVNVAISHTRWATHGGVSESNSHPHCSSNGRVAIVHNGIIENYQQIKDNYLADVQFSSETDTEVIPNLIDKFIDESDCVLDAIHKSMQILRGSYACAMLVKGEDRLYFFKSGSPLIIAKSDNESIVASDINGLKGDYSVVYLNDGDFGVIDNNVFIFDKNNTKTDINYVEKSINKSSLDDVCEDYMLKEIYHMPIAIKDTYASMLSSEYVLPNKIEHVLIVGCGTSYHSGLMGKKFIESIAGVSCECEIASEFIYNNYVVRNNTLAIFISQSGETADTLKSVRKVKAMGIYSLAVTNVENSSIHRECDECIVMSAGAEIAVASTKAYTTQLFVLMQLSNLIKNINCGVFDNSGDLVTANLSNCRNYLPCDDEDYLNLFNIDISQFEESVNAIADVLRDKDGIHFIGKDIDYVTAMEGSLKLKEISYKFTDAYPAGELKHGTLSLIDENSYSIAIVTHRNVLAKVKNAIHEIVARGGKVIVCTQYTEEFEDASYIVALPNINPILLSIVAIMPIDLLAYKVTKLLGLNPDKPRNLAKSVTVE